MRIAHFLSSLGKVLLASLVTGSVLAALGITPSDIFPGAADTIDQITDALEIAINWLVIWAVPNAMVGAIVIVPVWIILVLFGPKGK